MSGVMRRKSAVVLRIDARYACAKIGQLLL
jgi:hypothetical protein